MNQAVPDIRARNENGQMTGNVRKKCPHPDCTWEGKQKKFQHHLNVHHNGKLPKAESTDAA